MVSPNILDTYSVWEKENEGRRLCIAHPAEACYHAHVNVFTGTITRIAGTITRIAFGQDGRHRAQIACPQEYIPTPGQYIQAHKRGDENVVVPVSLFPGGWTGEDASAFITAPPIPADWQPGEVLSLRGPLGRGFTIPPTAKRIGLIALGDTTDRLLPLAEMAVYNDLAVALFTDARLPRLPTRVEANPLQVLPEALSWGDYLAFDGAPGDYEEIGKTLGISKDTPLPCPAEALIFVPMPCGGLGDCGVCAVRGKGRKVRVNQRVA
jgi:dihydroorotate dehydrogenase electron transfer subunit